MASVFCEVGGQVICWEEKGEGFGSGTGGMGADIANRICLRLMAMYSSAHLHSCVMSSSAVQPRQMAGFSQSWSLAGWTQPGGANCFAGCWSDKICPPPPCLYSCFDIWLVWSILSPGGFAHAILSPALGWPTISKMYSFFRFSLPLRNLGF